MNKYINEIYEEYEYEKKRASEGWYNSYEEMHEGFGEWVGMVGSILFDNDNFDLEDYDFDFSIQHLKNGEYSEYSKWDIWLLIDENEYSKEDFLYVINQLEKRIYKIDYFELGNDNE